MHQAFADRICRSLANAMREQPFGPDTVVWTVSGHMFAAYTTHGHGLSLRMDAFAAYRLVDQGRATAPPELSGEGWVLLPWETPPEELRIHIEASYLLVRSDGNGTFAEYAPAEGDEAE
ncbi:MmcQ/YjbR family DNA-binding protein [Roseibacterium sp. SDUM158016]|uniref:MmcQ/YjbR family DNA-binding protein n=1 Tax=Roseicyclus sediminis TaxID=2980997 RepID=UPI0021D24E00|nr:MmcQ/YjbR family DNA-binding protein [Roseibacterium sp. SDUM158016]MCU4653604.1 MmcQ/YjbR family DNA-binding protein [Roseibacterium sp. SDUM158016]